MFQSLGDSDMRFLDTKAAIFGAAILLFTAHPAISAPCTYEKIRQLKDEIGGQEYALRLNSFLLSQIEVNLSNDRTDIAREKDKADYDKAASEIPEMKRKRDAAEKELYEKCGIAPADRQ